MEKGERREKREIGEKSEERFKKIKKEEEREEIEESERREMKVENCKIEVGKGTSRPLQCLHAREQLRDNLGPCFLPPSNHLA